MTTNNLRVGHGYDVHRLKRGKSMRIGGVDVPGSYGVIAHSDGDVLVHALIDALLGASGQGDIGEHFPDTDPQFAGVDSCELLAQVVSGLADAGWLIVNADCTLVAEVPKISPYKRQMAERLAELMGLASDCVNVKATTTEKLDAIGEKLGIAAYAVVLIHKG